MPSNKTSIEVEAKGEFSQLTRGLRDVKSALGEVTKVVNTGARSGGFFSDAQVKSLDIFGRRFTDSMDSMNRLIDEQGEKIASLYKRRRDASSMDVAAIDKEIRKHGQYLDTLEKEREEMERMYALRRREASEFGSKPGGGGRTPKGGGGGNQPPVEPPEPTNPGVAAAGAGLLGLGRSMRGIGGFLAGLAGVALSINQLMKWEQMAEQNIQAWQPIIQRTGLNRQQMQGIGQSRGYNAFQTSQALDIYTQTAGRISEEETGRVMDFSRGYGVDVNTAAGIAGQMSVRGYGKAGDVLDRAAGVAEASGMSDRILEVLETSQGFLQSMDKNLKDNSGNSLLAYTARINQIGKENGASKLTGQAGASMLEQLGNNIFNPSNVRWQTMGINILSRYGGEETKKMDSFELMKTWQQGFQNPTNMKVLGQYLTEATKGMSERQAKEYKTLTLQEAMGGNTTLEQAEQFGELTNWLKEFNPDSPRMKELLKGGDKSGGGVQAQAQTEQKYAQWKATIDANIQISNAAWMNEQLRTGEFTIPAKLELQNFSTDLLKQLNDAIEKFNLGDLLAKKIKDALGQSLWAIVGELAGSVIAYKVAQALLSKLGKTLWDAITGKKGKNGGPGGLPPGGGPGGSPDVSDLGKPASKSVKRGSGTPFPKSADALDKQAQDLRKQLAEAADPAEKARIQNALDQNYAEQAKAHQTASERLKAATSGTPETVPNALSREDKKAFKLRDAEHKRLLQLRDNEPDPIIKNQLNDEIDQLFDNFDKGRSNKSAAEGAAKVASKGGGVLKAVVPALKTGLSVLSVAGDVYTAGSVAYDQIKQKNTARRLVEFQKDLDSKPANEPLPYMRDTKLEPAQTKSLWGKITDEVKNMRNEVLEAFKHSDSEQSKSLDKLEKDSSDTKRETIKAQGDMKTAVDGMASDVKDANKAMLGANLMRSGNGSSTFQQNWWDQLNMKDPSTWFNFGGTTATASGDVQQRVLAQLVKQGKGGWWDNVQKLMKHENEPWDPHPTPNPIAVNGEHAQGLFQFLPSTYKGYRQAGSADNLADATVEQQTDAFIAYMEKRYGGDFNNIKNFDRPNGNGPNDYKGYADGTYVARDQNARIHAGEELISRAKTGEVQRKTGKLPSQVLNEYLNTPEGNAGSTGAVGGQMTANLAASRSGETKRIVVDVNLNGAQALQGLPVEMIERIARQVFADAAYQALRPQVQF
jgi:hypothetical protein